MRFYHIPDRDYRKAAEVFFAGLTLTQRAGTSITGSDNVRTHYKMLFGVYIAMVSYHTRPPSHHIRIGSKGMADPDNIVPCSIQVAIGVISDPDIRQNLANLQWKGLISMKFLHTPDSKFMLQNKDMHELPLQKSFLWSMLKSSGSTMILDLKEK